MDKHIIVLYHAECPDGFAAAWCAWKQFGDLADYIPVFHNNTAILEDLAGRQIYLLDITYEAGVMKPLIAKNEVTVLDHHEMREKEIKMAQKFLFDPARSGAGLGWAYFFQDKKIPELLKYIQEEDTWKFKSDHVKEILAAVANVPGAYTDFKIFSELVAAIDDQKRREIYVEQGKVIIQYETQMVDEMIKRANPITFDGMDIVAVNSSVLVNEIGNKIASSHQPPVALIWSVRHGRVAFSLRSDGTVDVAKIAQKYGGGGHKAASAFTLPLDAPLPWKYRKDL